MKLLSIPGLIGAIFAALALYVSREQRAWKRETSILVSILDAAPDEVGACVASEATADGKGEAIENENAGVPTGRNDRGGSLDGRSLPPAARRYFRAVFPSLARESGAGQNGSTPARTIRSLRMKQRGSFLLDETWIPFDAVQCFSASAKRPGFVWDATMRLTTPVPLFRVGVNVRDAYIDGEGIMEGKLFGSFLLVQARNASEVDEGELMRWLAEAPLFPTSLLPAEGSTMEWSSDDADASREEKSSATVRMRDPKSGTKASLEMRFDAETGLMASLYGVRPMAVGDEFVRTPWEGRVWDYENHDGMLVPTRMEVGWWVDGELVTYFKGENVNYTYEYF